MGKSVKNLKKTLPDPPKIHLIAIGNELLNGETRETNLAWLTKWFTRRGGNVCHAAIIPDNFEAVGMEITSAIDKGIDLVVTTGGLGPTDDDSTMAAVASCIGLPIEINQEALGFVKQRIKSLSKYRPGIPTRLNKERQSMAVCPVGCKPLRNPVGVAPGMFHKIKGTTLIVLPGVPSEMKGIIKETLKPFWKSFFKGICYVRRNIILKGIPEAELAPFIRRANRKDPSVYVKSRLKLIGKPVKSTKHLLPGELRWQIILHFSVTECDRKCGTDRVNALVDFLIKDMRRKYKYPFQIDLNPGTK